MYAEIVSAVQSVKALSELLAAAKSLSNYNELVLAVSEVNSKLMAATAVALGAQEQIASSMSRIRELEAVVESLKHWGEQRSRYAMASPWQGGFVYSLRKERHEGEPPHWLCVSCFEAGKRAVLTQAPNTVGGYTDVKCNSCGSVQRAPFRSLRAPEYLDS